VKKEGRARMRTWLQRSGLCHKTSQKVRAHTYTLISGFIDIKVAILHPSSIHPKTQNHSSKLASLLRSVPFFGPCNLVTYRLRQARRVTQNVRATQQGSCNVHRLSKHVGNQSLLHFTTYNKSGQPLTALRFAIDPHSTL